MRFSVAVSREVAERVDTASRECGFVRSVVVRRAVEAGLEAAVAELREIAAHESER